MTSKEENGGKNLYSRITWKKLLFFESLLHTDLGKKYNSFI
jgi:hypothetical protein